MARRAVDGGNRRRMGRAATVGVSLVATIAFGVAGTVAHAEEPLALPDATVPTGEMDGAVVAVGLPPVPDTSVVVAVGEPPVPDTSVVVEVGEPPVPPFTVPDAEPVVVPTSVPATIQTTVPAAPAPQGEAQSLADVQSHAPQAVTAESVDPMLPETGPETARATAIVAGAAVSIGAALRALGKRP